MYKETLMNVTDLYYLHYNWPCASEAILKDIGDKLHKFFNLLYPPHKEVVGGCIVLTPSVRPASCVRSVTPTVQVGSILNLYILSSNVRRCVACKVSCKIAKFEFLAIF